MEFLKAFITGGVLCAIGQILIDKTKLTPAKILVSYVVAGAILGGLGIYQYIVDRARWGFSSAASRQVRRESQRRCFSVI